MCQNVSVRRTRDEVSFTYTYATVGPDENETASEAMWAMFQQRRKEAAWPSGVVFILIIYFYFYDCFTTEDLGKVTTNLESGKDIDPALLTKQL